jgi:hypothetical protein
MEINNYLISTEEDSSIIFSLVQMKERKWERERERERYQPRDDEEINNPTKIIPHQKIIYSGTK